MTDLLAGMPRWDLLVLTARNLSQHSIFQQQLEQLQLVERGFCRRFLVLADNPPSGCQRIGSGGATLDALIELEQLFGPNFLPNTRVLLLHSGGLSQRIPHVALTGKAFMLMPDSQTLLEHKLRSYKNFLRALHSSPVASAYPGFVFIASADVLEYFPPPADLQPFADVETDLLLITHNSSLQVAAQHGVFIQDPDGSKALWRVLQKPTIEELRRLPGAILKSADNNDEIALTDSCYLVRHRLVADLLRLRKENGSVRCELCCYRDFLCPLGSASKEEKMAHFSADKEGELYRWQRIIWEKMHDRKAQLLCLGPDSFFHFGTAEELLHHFLDRNSAFRHNFLFTPEVSSNLVNCRVEWPEMISAKSFAEWCQMDGQHYTVGDGCILSGLQFRMKENAGAEGICIHPGMCLCTWPIFDDQKAPNGDSATTGCYNYVTVLFHRDDDLKKLAGPEGLRWFGHTIVLTDTGNSLWDCPLFTVQPSAHRSLLSTLRAAAEGPLMKNTPSPLLSIAQVLAKVNVPEMLRQREALLKGGDT